MTTWAMTSQAQFLAYYDATIVEAHRYASRLTGNRAAAEDLVQDVYVGLLRQAREGRVTEVGVGWIVVAVRHRFLDLVRSAGREERRLRLVWSGRAAEPPDPPPGGMLDGRGLSDRERAALTLRYVDDLPVAEVAAALGTTVRATESLLARAKARVRRTEVRDA